MTKVFLLQFPVYTVGVTVAYRRMTSSWKDLIVFAPLAIHFLAVVAAVQVLGGSRH